eukprot:7389257-Prymnesium_polylepis.1
MVAVARVRATIFFAGLFTVRGEILSTTAPTAAPTVTDHPCGLNYGETASPGFEAYVCGAAKPYCVGFVAGGGWGSCSTSTAAPTAAPTATAPSSPPPAPPQAPAAPLSTVSA